MKNQKMKTLYVFGNEFLRDDCFAGIVSENLKDKFSIEHCRSPDDLLEAKGNIVILDVVKNTKEPILIDDVSKIKTRSLVSLHDFDLGFFLNLMEGMGINKKIKIIGIPMKGNAKEIAKKVEKWI